LKILYLLLDLAWFLFFSFLVSIPFWILVQISQSSGENSFVYVFFAAGYGMLSVIGIQKVVRVLSSTTRWSAMREKMETTVLSAMNGHTARLVKKWEYFALLFISAVGFAQTAIIIAENSKESLPRGIIFVHAGVFFSAFIAHYFLRGGSWMIEGILRNF